MRWVIRYAVIGAELTLFWIIVIVCVVGAAYAIYEMVMR